jgi:hypothetical protein
MCGAKPRSHFLHTATVGGVAITPHATRDRVMSVQLHPNSRASHAIDRGRYATRGAVHPGTWEHRHDERLLACAAGVIERAEARPWGVSSMTTSSERSGHVNERGKPFHHKSVRAMLND